MFDEIILLSEGQILYQGPHEEVMPYFNSLGYRCPDNMDIADFLQIIPTNDGRLYLQNTPVTPRDPSQFFKSPFSDMDTITSNDGKELTEDESRNEGQLEQESPRIVIGIVKNNLHRDNQIITYEAHGTEALVNAWKNSALFINMMKRIDDVATNIKSGQDVLVTQAWPEDMKEKYPGTFIFQFKLALERQGLIFIRDKSFIIARTFQNLFVGAIAGALFNNIPTENIQSTMGFLFFGTLFGGLKGFALIPGAYKQKAVFKKHENALIVSPLAFNLALGLVSLPLLLFETIIFCSIMYWSAGMCAEGGRFLTYILINFSFGLTMTQIVHTIAYAIPSQNLAQPLCGISIVLMVLFSGFILPPGQIPDWWIWFYYLNPVAYAYKAVVINQYTCPRYDFLFSTGPNTTERYGNYVLNLYGYFIYKS